MSLDRCLDSNMTPLEQLDISHVAFYCHTATGLSCICYSNLILCTKEVTALCKWFVITGLLLFFLNMLRFNEREYGLTIPAVTALTGISAFKHSTDQICQSFIIHHTTSTDSASLYCLMQFYTAV